MEQFSPYFLAVFAIAVRTTTAFMILPGFSAAQIPMRVRLFLALAVTYSVFFLADDLSGRAIFQQEPTPAWFLVMTLREMLVAAILAVPIRFLFLSLSFAGEITMQFVGMNPIPGTPIGDDQPATALSAYYNMAALVLFFVTGVHLHFIMALALSFEAFPPGEILNAPVIVERFATDLSTFFNIALRLSAPILVYSVVVNLIAGLVNKLTPQIPIYFVSTPFLIFGGLYILLIIGNDILFNFNVEASRLVDSLL